MGQMGGLEPWQQSHPGFQHPRATQGLPPPPPLREHISRKLIQRQGRDSDTLIQMQAPQVATASAASQHLLQNLSAGQVPGPSAAGHTSPVATIGRASSSLPTSFWGMC